MHTLTCVVLILTFFKLSCCYIYPPPVDPGRFNKTTPEMCRRDGYPVEIHNITTSDGYILGVHRLPYSNASAPSATPKPAVILHHGIGASSAIWFTNTINKRLVYLLVDNGYDVWLANSRGNLYSRNHTYLNPDEKRFWEFSCQEMGLFDLPALIDHVLATTGLPKVSFIGQSLGNTVFFILTSTIPSYNDKIKVAIALAPVAFAAHMESPPAMLLAPFVREPGPPTELIIDLVTGGTGEFAPNSPFWQKVAIIACSPYVTAFAICTLPVFSVFGFDYGQLNVSIVDDIWGHYPQGTSLRTFIHYGQFFNTGRFAMYDFGVQKNRYIYNANWPPDFALHKITAPLYMMAGLNDIIARPPDVENLLSKLTGVNVSFEYIDYPDFNHMDFIFAIDVNFYVNYPVMKILNKHNGMV